MAGLRQSLAIALAVCVLAGCGAADEGSGGGHPDYAKALAGAPPPLASLHRQSNDLLGGGVGAFESRLEGLKGYPVVVNIWASWCGPCRFEFPAFQQVSARYGKRVAFVAIDSQDSDSAAETFLGEHPVPYPSYTDPHTDVVQSIGAGHGLPDTAFYNRSGELAFLRQGPYANRSNLEADLRRYALGS